MTGPTTPSDENSKEFFARVSDQLSRRQLMGNAAKAGVGAMALGGLGAGTAAADSHEGASGDDASDGGASGDDAEMPSIADIVNYALTLERLEATYYEQALASSGGVFDEQDIEGSETAMAFGVPTLRYSTYQELEDVRDHELYHVAALEGVLEQLGAEDKAPTEFEFPDGVYDSVENFVAFAAVVEDLGVAAYAGAAPELAKAELAAVNGDVSQLQVTPAALGIHSIEARHAAFLRTLKRQRPWSWSQGPESNIDEYAIDDPMSMEEVKQIVSKYIVTGDDEKPKMASAMFADQTSDGSSVSVASASLPEGGFVVIHDSSLLDGNVLGSVVGVSEKLDAGTHSDVMVDLYSGVPGQEFGGQSSLQEDATLIAMPHYDTNDNGTYDFVSSGGEADGPYTKDGQAVVDDAMITVE